MLPKKNFYNKDLVNSSSIEADEAQHKRSLNKFVKIEKSDCSATSEKNELHLNLNNKKENSAVSRKMATGTLSNPVSFNRSIEITSINSENQENISSNITTSNVSVENGYNRINEDRFSSLNDESISIRTTTGYTTDTNNRATEYELNNHRIYDPISTNTAFERYDPSYNIGRSSIYSYPQSLTDDGQNNQKFHVDSHQTQHLIKTDGEENSTPIYPRPLYHFDPSNPNPPNGFSAINLSVKIAQTSYRNSSSPSPNVPIIDLSTSNITSSSSHFNRSSRSPLPGSSPQSNQVSSPSGQTLDLSVSRVNHR